MIIYTFFILTVGLRIGEYAERYDVYKEIKMTGMTYLIGNLFVCIDHAAQDD